MAGPPSGIPDRAAGGIEAVRDLAERAGGLVAGAAQGVADLVAPPRDVEVEKQQQAKKQALEKSMLPPPLLKRLSPVVQEMRFQLDPKPRRIHNDKNEPVHFNRIRVQEGYIALLYYGEGLLEDETYYGEILGRVLPFSRKKLGAKGCVIFSDPTVGSVAPAFRSMANTLVVSTHLETACLDDSQEQSDWDSEDQQGKKDLVTMWMGLDKFEPAAKPGSALTLSHLKKNTDEANADQKRIVDILAGRAAIAPVALGSKGYMTQLIQKTNWPSKHKTVRVGALMGIADFDAQQLVLWALGMETHQQDDKNYTFIGGLLEVLIGDLGSKDQDAVRGIIAKYNLIES